MKHSLLAAVSVLALSAGAAFAAPCSKGCCPGVVLASTKDKTAAAKTVAGVQKTTLSAPSIHCAGCLEGIKTKMMKQAGVKTVVGDPVKRTVTITYVSTQQTPQKLATALTKAGWPAKVQTSAQAKPVSSAPCSSCQKAESDKI